MEFAVGAPGRETLLLAAIFGICKMMDIPKTLRDVAAAGRNRTDKPVVGTKSHGGPVVRAAG